MGGLYLGVLERSGSDKTGFKIVKNTIGTIAIVLGVIIFMNLKKEGIIWEAYAPGKIELVAENNQAVIIDFYADWCIPSLEL